MSKKHLARKLSHLGVLTTAFAVTFGAASVAGISARLAAEFLEDPTYQEPHDAWFDAAGNPLPPPDWQQHDEWKDKEDWTEEDWREKEEWMKQELEQYDEWKDKEDWTEEDWREKEEWMKQEWDGKDEWHEAPHGFGSEEEMKEAIKRALEELEKIKPAMHEGELPDWFTEEVKYVYEYLEGALHGGDTEHVPYKVQHAREMVHEMHMLLEEKRHKDEQWEKDEWEKDEWEKDEWEEKKWEFEDMPHKMPPPPGMGPNGMPMPHKAPGEMHQDMDMFFPDHAGEGDSEMHDMPPPRHGAVASKIAGEALAIIGDYVSETDLTDEERQRVEKWLRRLADAISKGDAASPEEVHEIIEEAIKMFEQIEEHDDEDFNEDHGDAEERFGFIFEELDFIFDDIESFLGELDDYNDDAEDSDQIDYATLESMFDAAFEKYEAIADKCDDADSPEEVRDCKQDLDSIFDLLSDMEIEVMSMAENHDGLRQILMEYMEGDIEDDADYEFEDDEWEPHEDEGEDDEDDEDEE